MTVTQSRGVLGRGWGGYYSPPREGKMLLSVQWHLYFQGKGVFQSAVRRTVATKWTCNNINILKPVVKRDWAVDGLPQDLMGWKKNVNIVSHRWWWVFSVGPPRNLTWLPTRIAFYWRDRRFFMARGRIYDFLVLGSLCKPLESRVTHFTLPYRPCMGPSKSHTVKTRLVVAIASRRHADDIRIT